jgi:hypothetical protein
MQYWPAIVFGWPSVALGGSLLVAGVISNRARLCIAGGLLVTGFFLYISLHPTPLRWIALLALAGIVTCSIAVSRRASLLAALSLLPFFVVVVALAFAVLMQH